MTSTRERSSAKSSDVSRRDSPDAIRMREVNKWYGNFHVLCDIHLLVKAGERVALWGWGRSGSGKSTLLRCIAGLEVAQSGTMEIAGIARKVGFGTRPVPTKGIGMVSQSFNLFPHMMVRDNLTLGLRYVLRLPREEADKIALTHLARVKMSEHALHYPPQLSGGQQQRVAIARALCMQPRILLFDEPTSALDPELKSEVRETMIGLADEGLTMLVITHELELVTRLCQRVIVMSEGTIVEDTHPNRHFGNAR